MTLLSLEKKKHFLFLVVRDILLDRESYSRCPFLNLTGYHNLRSGREFRHFRSRWMNLKYGTDRRNYMKDTSSTSTMEAVHTH